MKSFLEKLKKVSVEKKLKPKESAEPVGQLAIDIYQTPSEIVIQAPIAGIEPENLEIFVENSRVTIKGERSEPEEVGEIKNNKEYLHQECYWGPFFREIILPEGFDTLKAEAFLKKGILIIKFPKIRPPEKKKIIVQDIK